MILNMCVDFSSVVVFLCAVFCLVFLEIGNGFECIEIVPFCCFCYL